MGPHPSHGAMHHVPCTCCYMGEMLDQSQQKDLAGLDRGPMDRTFSGAIREVRLATKRGWIHGERVAYTGMSISWQKMCNYGLSIQQH